MHVCHVDVVLAGLVLSAVGFRPKLSLRDGLLRCTLDVSDLTAHVRCRMVAVHAREVPMQLRTPADLATQAMMEAMAAQDAALAAAEARHAAADSNHVYRPIRVRQTVPHTLLVLVVNSTVSETACAAAAVLARPHIDIIHIVHIAAPGSVPSGAAQLLQRMGAVVRRRGIEPVTTCVVREEGQGLLETVAICVEDVGATLIVAGSSLVMEAGSANRGGLGGESFSLLLLRRLAMPMLLVTPQCK